MSNTSSNCSKPISTNKAIKYYANPNGQFMATLREVAQQKDWDLEKSWRDLDDAVKHVILYGTGDIEWEVEWNFTTKSRKGTQSLITKWPGFCHLIDDEYQRKLHNKNIQDLEDLLHAVECPSCSGSRLQEELLDTTFLGKNIHELSKMSIDACLVLMANAANKEDAIVQGIIQSVIPSIQASLQRISELGLGYLSLSRSANTLSGGERQRIMLAGQLSAHLFGVIYVLDEPTIGLDAKQAEVLIKLLKEIVSKGNTVVVVEHDKAFIRNADYLIEMGPMSGTAGGEVIYQGPLSGIENAPYTVTHKLLEQTSSERSRTHRKPGKPFGVKGAFANNLKQIDVSFSGQCITAITGISGSGKSSLMKDVLFASWAKQRAVGCVATFGFEQFEEVLLIDQKPLTQNRAITPASYVGILDALKAVFAQSQEAKDLGLKKADFSYQSKNGKCTVCSGNGKLKTSMDFMSDVWLQCHSCRGLRYNASVLSCTIEGYSIGNVLQMTVDELFVHFGFDKKIREHLELLKRVGLGHLKLGQAGNTLSGGEAQRLKLAKSLKEKRSGAVLYLFDEPSTGLHYFDILTLLDVFESIVDGGDTILFIEHNNALIESAYHHITLGPGSGERGGALVME